MTANLDIYTARKDNKTFLRHVYYQPPFKVADVTEDKTGETLHLMLMNSSPGVLDGDRYHITLELGERSSVHLHTQSYQRLYTMKTSASQQTTVTLGNHASLYYLPHPTVPHKESNFTCRNKIFLSDHNELVWAEILTCGRKGSGESFSYSGYHAVTEVMHNGKLVIKETLLMRPSIAPVHKIGLMEGYTHQASLIYWKEGAASAAIVTGLHQLLKDVPGVSAGVSSLQSHAVVVRLLGYKAEQLFGLLKQVAELIIKKEIHISGS